MSIQHHAQDAIRVLSEAFAPLHCHIQAPSRKGNFSFTLVNEHGIACHSERLYPEHYRGNERLQRVIERARNKTLTA
jgi:hypothetical protein